MRTVLGVFTSLRSAYQVTPSVRLPVYKEETCQWPQIDFHKIL